MKIKRFEDGNVLGAGVMRILVEGTNRLGRIYKPGMVNLEKQHHRHVTDKKQALGLQKEPGETRDSGSGWDDSCSSGMGRGNGGLD